MVIEAIVVYIGTPLRQEPCVMLKSHCFRTYEKLLLAKPSVEIVRGATYRCTEVNLRNQERNMEQRAGNSNADSDFVPDS